MPSPHRGSLVVLLALLLVLPAPLAAEAAETSRTLPGPTSSTDFTPGEAREVLAEAKSRIRRDVRREDAGRPVGHSESTEITMTLRDLFLARTVLTGTERRAAETLLTRPSDVKGDYVGGATAVAYPTRNRSHWCPAEGVACVHWVASGSERISTADADQDDVPDYVETVYATVKGVWDHEIGTLGYRAPLPDDGHADDPDNPTPALDIYLADLGSRGLYGYCAPEGRARVRHLTGYCILDNDYATSQFGTKPVNALRVTAAHEFFHLVQFAYDVDEDPWFMEGSATWVEDQVYDSIDDNRQFLAFSAIRHPRTSFDYSSGLRRYGAWLFFRYASERLGAQVVRQFWERADADSGRYSLQAVRDVVSVRTPWSPFVGHFGRWNTLPVGSYEERAGYPAPVWTLQKTLTRTRGSTGWRQVNLPHLASSAVRLMPHSRLSTNMRLEIRVDAPYASTGPAALVQRRLTDGRVLTSVMKLNKYGNGRAVYSFHRKVTRDVVVVVSNTSTDMRRCRQVTNADGAIYSCSGRGVHDTDQPYKVLARLL